MKNFRFRAAAVLDLRRKQEDDIRLVLASAEIAAHAADGRVVDARQAIDTAGAATVLSERDGVDAWMMSWHRSWIERLRLELATRQAEAAVSAAAVEQAMAAVQKAHQRRRTIERLRDRALQRYDDELRRSEMNEMNLLAGARFAVKAANKGDNE